MSEWRSLPLAEFVSIQRGHDLPEAQRKNGVVPVIGSFGGVTGYHNASKVAGPGVTIGRSGASFGVVGFVNEDYWPLNTVLYVTDFRGNDPYYVYRVLRQIDFSGFNSGSAQPSLNRNYIAKHVIKIPDLETQRQIAAILSAFDDKIELNRQMNRTLEAMARALFQSWFVDFGPVRAKMRGEQPEGMDAETAALFPDELEVVEGREVPKGWRVGTVSDVATQSKAQINPQSTPDALFCHFSIPAFDAGMRPVVELGADIKSGKFLLQPGVILVSKLNPRTPRVWNVSRTDNVDFYVSSTEFIPFLPKYGPLKSLLYSIFVSQTFTETLAGNASGTSNSHQRVKPGDISDAPILLPIEEVLQSFAGFCDPILDQITTLLDESSHLSLLRDALLPRLLSGKLDVSGWAGEAGA